MERVGDRTPALGRRRRRLNCCSRPPQLRHREAAGARAPGASGERLQRQRHRTGARIGARRSTRRNRAAAGSRTLVRLTRSCRVNSPPPSSPSPHTHAPGASYWPPAPGRDVWHTSAVIAARWRARATNPPSDTAERSSRRSVSPFGSCRHAGTPPPSVSGLREGFSAAHGTPRGAQDARGFSAARRGRLASAPVLPGRRSCVSGAAACSARTPW